MSETLSHRTSSAGASDGREVLDCRRAYLSPEVKLEPLVDRWYAWPHLLCPVRQALNLEHRYLPTIRSFLASPGVHISAAEDPAMFGGPFLKLPPGTSVDSVRRYLTETEQSRHEALAFVRELSALDDLLQATDGYCLDAHRLQMPDPLRGMVELVYDLRDHPKIRLLEEMLVACDLGWPGAQEILLHREADRARPFFLSTPRFEAPETLFVRTPFDSEAAKMLCEARTRPIDLNELSQLTGHETQALAPYFAAACLQPVPRYAGPGVRLRYFGHASVLIESGSASILIDPTAARDQSGDHFVFDDLPARIDVLAISHGHQDHFCPEVLMQLRDRIGVVVIPPSNRGDLADPSLRAMLTRLGFNHIVTLDPLTSFGVEGGSLTALPFTGEHCDLDVHSKQCLLVELEGRRICLFVDTDAIDVDVYRRLAGRLARPDLMMLGMECFGAPLSWLYGPLLRTSITRKNDTSRRMSGANCDRAWALTEALEPQRVFVYAMGQEPWMQHLMGLTYREDSIQLKESAEFVERCMAAGIPAERLYKKGELVLT